MSKYTGCGARVSKRAKDGGIDTYGKECVVIKWESELGKYKVDFDGGWCGWYKRSELIFDD